MKKTIDYSKSLCPAFDAVEDIKAELGPRWASASPLMARVTNPSDFAQWASFAGVEGFPVGAWYELYHGAGSWEKAWDKLVRESHAAQQQRPKSIIVGNSAQKEEKK